MNLDNDVFTLGLVLKNIDNFDMESFSGRLTLQKTIYMLQAFGLYLGYEFTWYLRGPYCSRLARNGFELQETYESVPRGLFEEKNLQRRFGEFLDFMEDKKRDPDRIEILASIHFLKSLYSGMTKSEIIDKVNKKQKYFTKKQCINAWDELKKEKLI